MATPQHPYPLGRAGVSEVLRRFVGEMPAERDSIYRFVRDQAARLPAGARVLDVGAGDAPYRELFEHVEYVTIDWAQSVHEDASGADLIASADCLPVADAGFDAVLLTQVLEHVPDPLAVLRELRRVLRVDGLLMLTAPLAWELHEMPHDYYRYTGFALEHLASTAGFTQIDVASRTDSFTTLAQLMRNVAYTLARAPDGLDEQRDQAGRVMVALADEVELLAPLDTRHLLPLGYTLTARSSGS